MNIWESLWLGQDKKCATCKKEVALEDTAKNSLSFKIVCQKCYDGNSKYVSKIILDEFANYPLEK